MRDFIGFCVSVVVCMACADSAAAHPRGPSAPYVVTAEDQWGRELRTFHHRGQTFVLGDMGERYNIRVRNRTGRRVEAVVSVDGRDVITGRVGDFIDGRGYIVGPYDEVLIAGFRQSTSEVAAFRFSKPEDSYSSRMGTPQHVGIIGVAVFPERVRPPVAQTRTSPLRRHAPHADLDALDDGASAAPPAPRAKASTGRHRGHRSNEGSSSSRLGSASAPDAADGADGASGFEEREARAQNLGTEYGETRESHVREVAFQRASRTNPASLITLRYDDRDGLIARGIRMRVPRAMVSQREPNPFPDSRFAPPPPRRY